MMNPGVTEEAGKTARSVVEGLKSTPLVLALILMNLIFIGFLVWLLNEISSNNRAQIKQNETQIAHNAKMITELQESLRVCRELIPQNR